MDVGSLSSSTSSAYQASGFPSMLQIQASTQSALLSLLPKSSSFGLGVNLDLYDAVGKQSMGLLAGGLEATELASISLGLDPKNAQSASVASAAAPSAPSKRDDTVDRLLKADGFTYTPNPYEVKTDFFAPKSPPASGSGLDLTA
jgi:hypothetical protein